MSFLSAAELTTAAEGLLNTISGGLPVKYDAAIIPVANSNAYAAIIRALVKRGFTKAQADTWADGAEYQRDIGLYFVCQKASGLDRIDSGASAVWMSLDRRAELLDIEILDSSYTPLVPARSRTIGGGTISTARDLYSLDPDDPRIGLPTEF